jgi:hypothetical protein
MIAIISQMHGHQTNDKQGLHGGQETEREQQPLHRLEERESSYDQTKYFDEMQRSELDSPDPWSDQEGGGGPEQTQGDVAHNRVNISEILPLGHNDDDHEEIDGDMSEIKTFEEEEKKEAVQSAELPAIIERMTRRMREIIDRRVEELTRKSTRPLSREELEEELSPFANTIENLIEENWPKGTRPRKEVRLSSALEAVLVKASKMM